MCTAQSELAKTTTLNYSSTETEKEMTRDALRARTLANDCEPPQSCAQVLSGHMRIHRRDAIKLCALLPPQCGVRRSSTEVRSLGGLWGLGGV